MKKIAFIQKCPSNVNFHKMYGVDGDIYNLSSEKVSRLLKRDVDLQIHSGAYEAHYGRDVFQPQYYDIVILVGSEALKMFTKATSVTDYTGKIVPPKPDYQNTTFIASISPAVLAFKPENKEVFDFTAKEIQKHADGSFEEMQVKKNYQYYTETTSINKYLQWLVDNPDFKVLAMDSETADSFSPRRGYMLGISISHEVDQGIYAHADCLDETSTQLLQKLIDTRRIVFHNAKYDMHWFKYHLGIKFFGRDIHDTMLMHYILDERQGTHGLKSLAMKYTNLGDYDRDLDEFKTDYCKAHGIKKDEFSYAFIPWDIIKIYAAQDTDATLQLYHKFYKPLYNNPKLVNAYENLLLEGLQFIVEMEDNGIPISENRLEFAKNYLNEELDKLKTKMYTHPEIRELERMQGDVFKPGSTQQLRVLLFDLVGLKPTGKLTDTGNISTDAEVMKTLAKDHELPQIILDIKQMEKLKNTYINKLIPVIDYDGRVRTGFNLSTTTSGRLSSSGTFNMQQLPRDNPIIKGCVTAKPGYRIVAVDLTTAEIYYAAVLSGDKMMQDVFRKMTEDPDKYPDFHSNIAHMVFNLPCEPAEVKKKFPALRQAAKAVSFGILYGSGAASVAEQVNLALLENGDPATCTKSDADEYIATYFNKFKQLKRWIDKSHNQIKQHGFIYNFFGRKRRLLNINSKDRGVASGEVRSGFNAIIQSVSSDHLLLGAIDAHKILRTSDAIDAKIFALVHDSIVAEVKEEHVSDYLELLYSCVQTDRGCSIPLCPIGLDQDSEEGGSLDYSCGKLEKQFPEIAKVDNQLGLQDI